MIDPPEAFIIGIAEISGGTTASQLGGPDVSANRGLPLSATEMIRLTSWSVSDFGNLPNGVAAVSGLTVGDVFSATGTGLIALSQMTGYAIFVNSTDWANLGSDYETATLIHEIIHKFGLNDGAMGAALGVNVSSGSSGLTDKLKECIH